MKNFISYFIIYFCLVLNISAQSDSTIQVLKSQLRVQMANPATAYSDLVKTNNNLSNTYFSLGKYPEAKEWYTKTLALQKKQLGSNHIDVATTYHNLGKSELMLGHFDQALKLNHNSLKIKLDLLHEDDPNVAKSYNNLGVIHSYLGNHKKEIEMYQKALNIYLKEGKNTSNIAMIYTNLARTYGLQGDFRKALAYHENALVLWIDQFGEDHEDVALSYFNIGIDNKNLGNYEQSLKNYNKTLKIWLPKLGENHPSTIEVYNRMAIVYNQLGSFEKALEINNRALKLWLEVVGEDHNNVGNTYLSIGSNNLNMGNYEKALKIFKKALKIKTNQYSDDHPEVAMLYYNLFRVYFELSQYDKSMEYVLKAFAIWEKQFGKIHYQIASCYNGIGKIHLKQKNYESALVAYHKGLKILKSKYDSNFPSITTSNIGMAIANQNLNNYEAADSLWTTIVNDNIKRLNSMYLFLPDNERLAYSNSLEEIYSNFYSYIKTHSSPKTKQLAAHLLVNTKSLALDYSVSFRELIHNLDDDKLTAISEQLDIVNRNLSQAELMTEDELQQKNWDISTIKNEQDALTQQLLTNKTVREKLSKKQYSWSSIQNQLSQGEIFVDFIRFFDRSKNVWLYYSILTRKDSPTPQFILISDQKSIAKLLEANKQTGQPNYIQDKEALGELHQKIWTPLAPYLQGITTVHLSPSGLLHRVDFEALQDENNNYLADKFEFHRYSTMRDFAAKKKTDKIRRPTALLVGDIIYEKAYNNQNVKTSELTQTKAYRDGINPLPGTAEEINTIGKIINKKRGKSIYITSHLATEDTILHYTGANSPDIMHLATHGKYLDAADVKDTNNDMQQRLRTTRNPMQRLMLMLSGANKSWTSNEYILHSSKDGILTASEISNLDFSNTKLVVLSACNTGLGDIHDTEGVLGLQHAFKLAGAKHVIVSLWKVNDTATKDLMILFYKNLLAKKQSPHAALQQAKEAMRENGAQPEHWAGFILME